MKKCLLLVILLLVSQLNNLQAQQAPCFPTLIGINHDTACINQPIQFTSLNTNASSYYWSFCSANLNLPATCSNLGKTFNFQRPTAIDIVKDSGNYYGFVLNDSSRQILLLRYGNTLANIPSVTNLGDLTKVLPVYPHSLCIVLDTAENNWHVFVGGGYDSATSSLARIDFGHSLNNDHPNIANFGNFMGTLNDPRGINIAKEDGIWYGYCVNFGSNPAGSANNILRLEFDKNISNTPLMFLEGNPGNVLNQPTDMKAVYDCLTNSWFFYVTNFTSTLAATPLARIDMGSSLATPNYTGNSLAESDNVIISPAGLSITRDCGTYYVYITNYTASGYNVYQVETCPSCGGATVHQYINVNMDGPTGISRIIRDHDDVYAYITNNTDSSLSRVLISHCTNVTLPSSTAMNPPTVSFPDSGTYNVYYEINSGQPDMQTQCTQVYVHPYPRINFPHDTTICHPLDTIALYPESVDAEYFIWSPAYNIKPLDSAGDAVKIWPEYSTTYSLTMAFPDGCIVDTPLHITVVHVRADAGPDRTIADGASTILGGPLATTGPHYNVHWFPSQFLNNVYLDDPTATPPYDYTYYQQIDTTFVQVYPLDTFGGKPPTVDTITCTSIDTVVVHVVCNDLNLPNAFVPGSVNPLTNHWGLINTQIVKLNYLKVFDRWGALVFETTDATGKWDGKVNGKDAASGVYVWEADGFCNDGKKFTRKGNVTLIR